MERLRSIITNRNLYILALLVAIVGLPLSKFLTGAANFFVLGAWLVDTDYKTKLKRLKNNKPALVAALLYLVHVIWLFNSQNFVYAFHDLKVKMPYLLFVLVFGSIEPLSKKELRFIIGTGALAAFIASGWCVMVWLGFTHKKITDIRNISVFISHIRFSLLICLYIFFLSYYIFNSAIEKAKWKYLLSWALLIWFIIFLFILKSLTGLFALLFIGGLLIAYKAYKSRSPLRISITALILLGIPVGLYFYTKNIVNEFKVIEEVDTKELPLYTAKGNLYEHDILNREVENGHRVAMYVSWPEMLEAWGKRSGLHYDSLDGAKQKVKFTLLRYLTSKGLHKDETGVMMLTSEDIENIENGIPNYKYADKFSLYPRIHQVVWEYYNAKNGKNSSGHSIVQRFEFWENAYAAFKNNMWLGVGIGDVNDVLLEYYEWRVSYLEKEWRLRAHNQFLTFLLTFGIIGFSIVLFVWIYPLTYKAVRNNYLFMVFYALAMLSFINEDTLETQAGVMFYALFYCLTLFHKREEEWQD